jgi:hypothetical protein
MVHERDRLPFGLEAREDRARAGRVRPDQLDRNPALYGFGLIRHPDRTHTSFADLLEQLVPPGDDRAF